MSKPVPPEAYPPQPAYAPPYAPPYDPAYAPPSYSQAVGAGMSQPGPYVEQIPKGPAIVTTVVPVGPNSTRMICPHCHFEISTSTKTQPGLIAYISGTLIALLGCWFGCCLIPCCIDECMDIHHSCPNCKAYLGRYRR